MTLLAAGKAETTNGVAEMLEEYRKLQELGLICRSGNFSPNGVHYPPITLYPEITEEQMFDGYTMPDDGLLDIYAHIPFCERRCVFCHYPVKLGHKWEDEKDRYLNAFEKEMDLYMRRLGIDKIQARSILVGGGTPTFLNAKQLTRFLDLFTDRVDMSQCTQFNYDLDPGSFMGELGRERARIMRDYGVDRLTFGVQSLDENVLKLMNRPHGKQEVYEAIELSRELGYQINVEFIFGHPGETIDNWRETMEEAVTLDVDEIQLYRLKVEAYGDYQGPVKKYLDLHPDAWVTNEDQIVMKQIAHDTLDRHGFKGNLRRVFSKKREHYSHYADNQCCKSLDEIGLGLTAFSSLRDRYVLNTPTFSDYYRRIEEGKLPLNRGLARSPDEQIRWALILPLKNRDIYKPTFRERTGVGIEDVFRPKFDRLKQYGLVEENDSIVVLTELGKFFADEVVAQFFAPQYMPEPREAYAEGPLNPYLDNEPFE